MARSPRASLLIASGVLASGMVRAQPAEPSAEAPVVDSAGSPNTPPTDQGAVPQPAAASEREKKLAWRGTSFNWANRVSAQTLGIGDDFQSSNPYYEWFFSLRPRYYIWEEGDHTLSLRATLNAVTELTNSDTTTKRGEFLLDDSTLALVGSFTLAKDGDYKTLLGLTAPRFVIPTSKASQSSGIYGELGARASITQDLPIRSGEAFFPRGSVGARVGYGYLFSSANVPVNADLDRLRRNVDGVTVSNDQLGGAALAQHRAGVHAFGSLDVYKDVVALSTELGMDWFWKFPLAPAVVMIDTGPTPPIPTSDEGRLSRSLYFNAELAVNAIDDILTVGVGYESFPNQLGAGGRRRSVFYNPDALVYLGVELSLDGLYLEAAGQRGPSEVASAR